MTVEPLPGPSTLTLYVGDSREWVDTFTNDTGTPYAVNFLVGHTFRAQVRASLDPVEQPLATMTVTPTAANVLTRTLSATQALNLASVVDPETGKGQAFWDLEVTITATGFVRTWLAGKVKVLGDVSRAT